MIDCPVAFQQENASHRAWTSLEAQLLAVNYKQAPYSVQYPDLFRILDEDPTWPVRNRWTRNGLLRVGQAMNMKSVLLRLSTTLTNREDVLFVNNVSSSGGLFVNELQGDYTPWAGSELALSGFQPVSRSSTGVIPNAFIAATFGGVYP